MRIALYSPYIPKHHGGGEKYLLSIAQVASKKHTVSLLVPKHLVAETQKSLQTYSSLFGLDLSRIQVEQSQIGVSKSPLRTMVQTMRFDSLFAMTDGSFFPTFAHRSYLIVQVPWTRQLSQGEQFKLRSWSSILVYSEFCKEVINKHWHPRHIEVVSPYVDHQDFPWVSDMKKNKTIINVGRFFKHHLSNSKRQDVLIDAFIALYKKGSIPGYSMELIGNIDPGEENREFVEALQKKAHGFPIRFKTDLSYTQLIETYQHSSIYWHAAGFEVNQDLHPENTEHFGITTLEAMATGCIPFVVPKGGQEEVVADTGYRWEDIDQLCLQTTDFLSSSKESVQAMRKQVVSRSKYYSKDKFDQKIEKLLV